MNVRIYQTQKSTMQSGRGKTGQWMIQPLLSTARRPDYLIGWVGAGDTESSIRLKFATRDQAVAFATKQGWHVMEETTHPRIVEPRNYVQKFQAWLKET